MGKSSTGLSENVAGLLCYVLLWVSGLVFVLIEKDSKFVRFHAIQSIYVFGALTVIAIILGWIPIVGTWLNIAVWVVAFIFWIILMVKAYNGEKYKMLWAGNQAERWVK